MKVSLLSILALIAPPLAYPCTGFLPTNTQVIPTLEKSGLSEDQFNSVIEKVNKVYAPIARSKGAQIFFNRLWDDPTVNAGTLQRENGKVWQINLYGGFARHPKITEDGYALVICHEIGHHLGGAPKKGNPNWSSSEGQADYFATLKCLRKVFRWDDNISAIEGMVIPDNVSKECSLSFKTQKEVALCIRTTLAGLSVGQVSAMTQGERAPSLYRYDSREVEVTYEAHPKAQCRLDTYFNGSICEVSSYIPLSQTDEVEGTCHERLGHEVGLRPACWFKHK